MNHRPRTVSPLVICLALLLTASFGGAGAALAQTPLSIPAAAKNAADATPYKSAIDKFITENVERLKDVKTPANVKRGRDSLEQQVAAAATPSFMSIYTTSLDAQLQPLAASKDLVTRLNAAIVVARVAQRTQNPGLAPSAAKFMNDPSDAVALWGVKAAKALIPVLLNLAPGFPDPLTPNLANVVKRHWFSGPIAYEAYDALRLNTAAAAAGGAAPAAPAPVSNAPPANNAAIQAAAKQMIAIFSFRVDLYAKGVPPQPTADVVATEFLTRSRVWPLLDEPQKMQVLQSVGQLITQAGQHAAAVGPDLRWSLNSLLQYSGGSLQVIGDYVKDANISTVGGAVRTLGQAAAPASILKATGDVWPAIQKSGKVKALKPAPALNAAGKPLSPNQTLEEEAGETGGAGDRPDADLLAPFAIG